MRFSIYGILTIAVVFSGAAPLSAQELPLNPQQIDRTVDDAMRAFAIPGVSVAVIQPGQPAYLKGYGNTGIENTTPVDQTTMFGIGSISKAFTTTLIAMLVEEGKLRWDDRVIDHLPEFRLADSWVTREFTIRDLVTHRSGLAPYAGDLVMLVEGKSTKPHVYRALANLPAETSFRTTYAYDNLLYIVAGDLIEKSTGETWEDVATKRILEPLGMTGCVADQDRLRPDAKRAIAHDYADGKLTPVHFPLPRITVAAGGIHCNAAGMAQWMSFNLRPDKRLKIGAAALEELFKPVTPIPVNPRARQTTNTTYSAYGLGWVVQDAFGQRQVSHGGGLPGMVSWISLFPDKGFGVMVMTNKTSSAAKAIATQLAARAFGDAGSDFVVKAGAEELQSVRTLQDAVKKGAVERSPADGALARPPLPLASYAGRYEDRWFGDVDVRLEAGTLVMDMGSKAFTARLKPIDGDRFLARWARQEMNADAIVSFSIGSKGEVTGATMRAVSEYTDKSYDFHDLRLVKVKSSD